jgi:hypothetical protein
MLEKRHPLKSVLTLMVAAPKRFADARTLRADGRQADYGQLHQRLFFPTESNSYGAAITRNVDIILDEIGADGVYWDEHEYSACAYHYGPPWDGASGDIDPRTMTLRRLKSSVILLSEPWRLAMAKRILARGPLVGNGVPRTRAMANLKFPCFVETGSISHCTKAQRNLPSFHCVVAVLMPQPGPVFTAISVLSTIPSVVHSTETVPVAVTTGMCKRRNSS